MAGCRHPPLGAGRLGCAARTGRLNLQRRGRLLLEPARRALLAAGAGVHLASGTLATRLWNACVDRANSTALARGPSARAAEAEIRQAAPELLLLAGIPDEIPLAAAKLANFFFRAGQEWLQLGRVDLATACFEKATPLVSATGSEEDLRVLLDLNLARARAASDAGDQSLAVALLSRSKPLASASPKGIKSLAESYLSVVDVVDGGLPSWRRMRKRCERRTRRRKEPRRVHG